VTTRATAGFWAGVLTIWAGAPAPAPAPARAQTATGYRYTFTVTGDATDPASGTTVAAGDRTRIDFDGKTDPQYVIVDNRTHTITLVYPDRREYSVVADTTFQRLVGAVLAALPVVSVQLTGATVTDTTLGPGEPVAGHPTSRYEVVQDFTVSVGAFGFQAAGMHQRVTTEYWLARDLRLPANPLVTILSQVTTVLAQNDRDFAHRSAQALRPVARGTPLKMVIHTDTRTGSASGTTSKTTVLQVTSIARAAVPLSAFEVPAGYTRKEPQLTGKLF